MVTLPKLLEPDSSATEAPASDEQNENLDLQATLGNFDKILSKTVNFGVRLCRDLCLIFIIN